jgi:hypothetical protein
VAAQAQDRLMELPNFPESIRTAANLDEAARGMGAFLGIDGGLPLPAARRALDDPRYAAALIATRKMPQVLAQLLARHTEAAAVAPGTLATLSKAASAALKWGMSGLQQAKPWVIERRIAACTACDHLAPAPDTLLYRGAKVVAGPDAKICGLCHCLVNTKVALATELCPDRDSADPERSRWGEPWVPPEKHLKSPWA